MKQKKTKAPDPHKPLTAAEFRSMKKWHGFSGLPENLQQTIHNTFGRPKLAAPKEHINLRLDADLVSLLRASGPGWQTRLNSAVREWLGA